MTTNSLAFRLFATAAAWNLLVLPIAGAIIYSLYRQEVETSFDRRLGVLLTVVLSDTIDHGDIEPGAPKDVGEPLFEVTHSGWYWQIKPLDGKPGHLLTSRSLTGLTIPLPSEHGVEPNEREVRWANLDGPLEQKLRVAETIYVFGEGKKAQRYSVAVAGTLGEVETSLYNFRTRLTLALALAGIGLLAVTCSRSVSASCRWRRWRRAWPPSARARRRGSTCTCPTRSSRCSRSSTRSSSPTRTSSSAPARTSATWRTP